jgi:hypothetical protein
LVPSHALAFPRAFGLDRPAWFLRWFTGCTFVYRFDYAAGDGSWGRKSERSVNLLPFGRGESLDFASWTGKGNGHLSWLRGQNDIAELGKGVVDFWSHACSLGTRVSVRNRRRKSEKKQTLRGRCLSLSPLEELCANALVTSAKGLTVNS